MSIHCPTCHAGPLGSRTLTMTFTRGPLTAEVHGVPAMVCDQCGEQIITGDTMQRIEGVMAQAGPDNRTVHL